MQTKLRAMHDACDAIQARATAEIIKIQRPVQNEALLHYHQARDMEERARVLDLIPGVVWPLGQVLERRRQALAAASQLQRFSPIVSVSSTLMLCSLRDEEELAIDPDMSEDDVTSTLVGYLDPYVRAIGIRRLKVRALNCMFDDVMYLELQAPVFP